MYDILRARITRINEKTLEEHFDVERVSGEFTREFNITTTSLPNRVLAGKKEISSSEVSIDQEFSKSLGVKL
jgi:predicted lysophospholipase L1 biosynthesis ABC-type transport system permease subunit